VSKLVGIWGKPYIDLSPFVDISSFAELDREITAALCRVDISYTGGTLKWMGVVAPWVMTDGYADAMHVLEKLDPADRADFIALGDDPTLDPTESRDFGDETDHPFNHAQMRWLSFRHGVYFPWKVCFHLLENDRWEDKHSGDGKHFVPEAGEHFPKTLRFIQRLPFREIGRVVVFGLEPNDHAPAHRDTKPGAALQVAQSISFDPRGNKGLYLMDDAAGSKTVIDAPIYWFNDMDYHGVDPAKCFRYSIRVDGVFEPDFVKRVQAGVMRGP
jgi:Rieske 2Fe-2S family protein